MIRTFKKCQYRILCVNLFCTSKIDIFSKRELVVVKDIVEEDSLLDTSKLVNDKLIRIAKDAKLDISEILELRSKNDDEEETDKDQRSDNDSAASNQRTLAQSTRDEQNQESLNEES